MAQLANEKGWIEIVIIIPALALPHLLRRCFTFIYLSGKVCYIHTSHFGSLKRAQERGKVMSINSVFM